LAGWVIVSAWIVLPLLPILGFAVSRLVGASDF
jgi:hypothetical protein